MRKLSIVIGVIFILLILTGPPCLAESNVIYGCYQKEKGILRVVKDQGECLASEVPISLNTEGPKGDQGNPGPQSEQGPPGPEGPQGPKGDAPAHEWNGTRLRFQNPDETWGEFTDLGMDDGGKLERQISESEERVKDYAERSSCWALWTLRLIASLGAIVAVIIAAGSIAGFLGAKKLREEAAAAAKIRADMEAHFADLKDSFVGFAKTIDIPRILHSKEKLTPIEEERFKEFDIQLLLSDVIGVKLDAEIFESLGWFWHTLRVSERALLRFDKALALDPTRVDSIYGKGVSLGMLAFKVEGMTRQNEMRKEALNYIDRAVDQAPNSVRYLFGRGWILDEMDRFPEALDSYEQARRIEPADSKITYNIACTYARSKKYQKALAELKQIKEDKAHMTLALEDSDFAELRIHPKYGQKFSEIVK